MILLFKLVLTSVLVIHVISCQGLDDYDYSLEGNVSNFTYNSTDIEMDYDSDDGQCSADAIIEQMTAIFTPDDYEEGKQNIKDSFENFNQTLIAINRLQQYTQNISEKMSEFSKRLSNRLSEVLMTVDLPPDCMNSLVRIGSAAKNGDLWALKCMDIRIH